MLPGLLILIAVLVGLLAIPVNVVFRVSWPNERDSHLLIRWGFGLVKARIPFEAHPKDKGSSRPRSTSKRPRKRGRHNVLAAARLPAFRRRVLRFLRDIWHSIGKNDIYVRARIGLGDPADTGQLWAVVGPLAAVLTNARHVSVIIEPDFMDATAELAGSGRVRVMPLQIIYLALGVLLSPPVWQGLRAMRAQ